MARPISEELKTENHFICAQCGCEINVGRVRGYGKRAKILCMGCYKKEKK